MAVGLSTADDLPTYNDLYSAKDPSRYVCVKAGREFEFSDGESFVVMAYMDGGATAKPVLRLGLVPLRDTDMAASVRRQLGLVVSVPDDEGMKAPQTGLVQSASGGIRLKAVAVVTAVVAVAAMWV